MVLNKAIAISAPELFHKLTECAKAVGLQPEEIPSFSWIKFQFLANDSIVHSAANYTGCLKFCYMMQQWMIAKDHEDIHYSAAIYRYAQEFAITFKEYCTFICIDDRWLA